MKKVFLALVSAALVVSLCACGSSDNKDAASSQESTQTSAAATADASEPAPTDDASAAAGDSTEAAAGGLKDIYEKVKAEVQLPESMSDFSEKRLERVLGITSEEIDDFAGGVCTDGVQQDQIIYVKAKDESQVASLQEKLQNNWQSIYNVIQNYDPKQKENIENAKVETNGLYVSLVISPDAEKIKSIFSENLA